MKTNFVLPIFLLVLTGYSRLAQAQSSGTFAPTANMATGRTFHTATLLLDGRVLIVGGQSGSTQIPVFTTEIYDPATQVFTPSGTMMAARSRHTATLLPDGRVLIVGGDAAGSAEIYNPSTGSFTATGSLLMSRHGFNATLLKNGKVLITGGIARSTESCDVIGDAELFDPSTGLFTGAGAYVGTLANLAINVCGFDSTSTLLPDGKVLFATEPSAQIYDPVSAAFTPSDTMLVMAPGGGWFAPDYIVGRTANLLLNGKVLMAGGEQEDTGRYNSAELFDASSDVFVPTASMIRARNGHTATLLPDGSVLMAGGESERCDANNACFYSGIESSAELYDPVKSSFADAGSMLHPRDGHTATLLKSGEVLLTGGEDWTGVSIYSGPMSSAELYRPAAVSPPPALFALTGDGRGQGAIWHAATGEIASPGRPAFAGEILSMYASGLAESGVIPPQVSIGGRLGEVLYFGPAPGYPGYYQVNFRVPNGVASGPDVSVRLTYLGRASNGVTIALQ
jgi:hypothetical protein